MQDAIKINGSDITATTPSPVSREPRLTCHICGTELDPNWLNCPKCEGKARSSGVEPISAEQFRETWRCSDHNGLYCMTRECCILEFAEAFARAAARTCETRKEPIA